MPPVLQHPLVAPFLHITWQTLSSQDWSASRWLSAGTRTPSAGQAHGQDSPSCSPWALGLRIAAPSRAASGPSPSLPCCGLPRRASPFPHETRQTTRCPCAHLGVSDGQVGTHGVQHGAALRAAAALLLGLAVHVEEDGQEVFGKATHFCSLRVWGEKDRGRRGSVGPSAPTPALSGSLQGTGPPGTPAEPPTCLAAPVDEGAQGLAHGGAEVRALADGHAQGACQPFEGPQHVRGVGAEAGQQAPDLERAGRRGRRAAFGQDTAAQPGTMDTPQQGGRHPSLPATAVCRRSWTPGSSQPGKIPGL